MATLLTLSPAPEGPTAPAATQAHEGRSAQTPEAKPPRSPWRGYLAPAGLVVFGIGYLPPLAVGIAAAARHAQDEEDFVEDPEPRPQALIYPLVGPFLAWANLPTDYRTPKVTALVVADTAVQLGGLAMLSAGLAIARIREKKASQRRAQVLPCLTGSARHGVTFGLSGRF